MYKGYERGRVDEKELSSRLVDDLGVMPTEAFKRKMMDHNLKFHDVVRTLNFTDRPDKSDPKYFGSEKAAPVRSRNAE